MWPRLSRALAAAAALQLGLAAAQPAPSLYERVGRDTLSAIARDYVSRLLFDPQLNRNPEVARVAPRVPAEYMRIQIEMVLCERSGGPCRHGGRPLDEALSPLRYSRADWERSMALFRQVLADHGIKEPEAGELAAIISAMEGHFAIQDGRPPAGPPVQP
jgi:truncated hemoglobin YjbI